MTQLTFGDLEYSGKRKRTRREIFLAEMKQVVLWQELLALIEVVKRQFGFQKVRFKGLVKNTAQVITLFALSNLWMARRRLLAMTG